MKRFFMTAVFVFSFPISGFAQHEGHPMQKNMTQMDQGSHGQEMAGEEMAMPMRGMLGSYPMTREASGTSWQPDATPHGGIHTMKDD